MGSRSLGSAALPGVLSSSRGQGGGGCPPASQRPSQTTPRAEVQGPSPHRKSNADLLRGAHLLENLLLRVSPSSIAQGKRRRRTGGSGRSPRAQTAREKTRQGQRVMRAGCTGVGGAAGLHRARAGAPAAPPAHQDACALVSARMQSSPAGPAARETGHGEQTSCQQVRSQRLLTPPAQVTALGNRGQGPWTGLSQVRTAAAEATPSPAKRKGTRSRGGWAVPHPGPRSPGHLSALTLSHCESLSSFAGLCFKNTPASFSVFCVRRGLPDTKSTSLPECPL